MGFNFSDMYSKEDEEDQGPGLNPGQFQDVLRQNLSEALAGLTDDENEEEYAEESTEEQKVLTERERRVSEARARVELANLYITVMNSNLFAEGSARPEIHNRFEEELKVFAADRLGDLLGMKKKEEKPKAPDLFGPEEVTALKLLASKITKNIPPSAMPKPKTEELPKPTIKPIATVLPQPVLNRTEQPVVRTASTPGRKPKPKPASQPQAASKPIDIANMTPEEARLEVKRRKEASGQVATGRSNQAPKPLAMPTIEMEIVKAARDVETAGTENTLVNAMLTQKKG